jgi:hypothetical protein
MPEQPTETTDILDTVNLLIDRNVSVKTMIRILKQQVQGFKDEEEVRRYIDRIGYHNPESDDFNAESLWVKLARKETDPEEAAILIAKRVYLHLSVHIGKEAVDDILMAAHLLSTRVSDTLVITPPSTDPGEEHVGS